MEEEMRARRAYLLDRALQWHPSRSAVEWVPGTSSLCKYSSYIEAVTLQCIVVVNMVYSMYLAPGTSDKGVRMTWLARFSAAAPAVLLPMPLTPALPPLVEDCALRGGAAPDRLAWRPVLEAVIERRLLLLP